MLLGRLLVAAGVIALAASVPLFQDDPGKFISYMRMAADGDDSMNEQEAIAASGQLQAVDSWDVPVPGLSELVRFRQFPADTEEDTINVPVSEGLVTAVPAVSAEVAFVANGRSDAGADLAARPTGVTAVAAVADGVGIGAVVTQQPTQDLTGDELASSDSWIASALAENATNNTYDITSVYGCWYSRDESLMASTCKCENPCNPTSEHYDAEICESAEGDRFRAACDLQSNCKTTVDSSFPCDSAPNVTYGDITCPEMMGKVVLSAARCQQTGGEYWADGSSRCSEANNQEIKVCSKGGWTALTYPSPAATCYRIGNLTGTGTFGCPYFQATTFTIMAAYERNGLDINGRVVKYNFNEDLSRASEEKERAAVTVPCTSRIRVNCTRRATTVSTSVSS